MSVTFVVPGTPGNYSAGEVLTLRGQQPNTQVRVLSAEFDATPVPDREGNIWPGLWTVSVEPMSPVSASREEAK